MTRGHGARAQGEARIRLNRARVHLKGQISRDVCAFPYLWSHSEEVGQDHVNRPEFQLARTGM